MSRPRHQRARAPELCFGMTIGRNLRKIVIDGKELPEKAKARPSPARQHVPRRPPAVPHLQSFLPSPPGRHARANYDEGEVTITPRTEQLLGVGTCLWECQPDDEDVLQGLGLHQASQQVHQDDAGYPLDLH